MIRRSKDTDVDLLMPIFDEARGTIASLGIDQWQNGYPSRDVIERDVRRGQSYLAEVNGEVEGTFVLIDDGEPTYDRIYDGRWLTGNGYDNYVAIHRVAISVKCRGSGLSGRILEYAADYAKMLGRDSLRIDTHEGNKVMRRMLEKNGFVYCGIIYLSSGEKRVAYEKYLF